MPTAMIASLLLLLPLLQATSVDDTCKFVPKPTVSDGVFSI